MRNNRFFQVLRKISDQQEVDASANQHNELYQAVVLGKATGKKAIKTRPKQEVHVNAKQRKAVTGEEDVS